MTDDSWKYNLGLGYDPPPFEDVPPPDDEPPDSPTRPRQPGTSRPGSKTRTKSETAGRFGTINSFIDTSLARLNPADALVWFVLWRDTGPNGLARPSQAYIARRVGISTRTVKRSLKRLRDEGLVSIVRSGGLKQGSSVYRIYPVGRSPRGT